MELLRAGRFREAGTIYEEVLRHDPDHPDANNLSGLIALQSGDPATAIRRIAAAIRANPNIADLHFNLGMALQESGLAKEAFASYRRAAEIDPGHVGAQANMGALYRESGKLEDAVVCFRNVLSRQPDFPEGHSNLGVALHELGRMEEAEACHRRAIALNPDYAEAHSNLGNVLRDRGQLEKAIASQNRALTLKPDFAPAHAGLGMALAQAGRIAEAAQCYCMAVSLSPATNEYWSALAGCIGSVTFTTASDELLDILMRLTEWPTVNPRDLTSAAVSALLHRADIARLVARASSDDDADATACSEAMATLGGIPLLLKIMERSVIANPDIETLFVWLRRLMLAEAVIGRGIEGGRPFAAALAHQCFANEYVFWVTEEESAGIEILRRRIAESVGSDADISAAQLCLLAAYRPLSGFPWAAALAGRAWPADVARVVTRQVAETAEEDALKGGIRCLTPIRDAVSRTVRDQYEDHPFPRWHRPSLHSRSAATGDVLAGMPLVRVPGNYVSPTHPEILIAGCGTGRHALTAATRYRNARVLAVDLSRSSLAHAIRKTREIGVANIDYAQADIMELGGLDRRFDLIESVGVLHHLGDPVAGWRVLTGLLRPGGLMKVGLYSDIARRAVVRMRAAIAESGYDATADGIRRFRRAARAGRDDGDYGEIVGAVSFYSMSECRDYLFHVQEHRFNLRQIQAILDDLGFDFLGFEIRDPVVIHRFRNGFPGPDAAISLSPWQTFEEENPATFRSMYQFWCRKR